MTAAVGTVHERGRAAILAGQEYVDVPPVPGARRWGLSVLLRPDNGAVARLAEVAEEVARLAGPGHWQTGAPDSSHLTVRSLEPVRPEATADDPRTCTLIAAVERTAARCAPVDFDLSGLSLAPGGVLAQADPAGPAAARLRETLVGDLPDGGAFEGDYRGDRWWSSLVHFAAPVGQRQELVDWVEARRTLGLGPCRAKVVELVRYEFDGVLTRPVPLASFQLGG